MGTPAIKKYLNIKCEFTVVTRSDKKEIANIIREVSEQINITLSKIEKVEGVKLVTGYNIDTKEL